MDMVVTAKIRNASARAAASVLPRLLLRPRHDEAVEFNSYRPPVDLASCSDGHVHSAAAAREAGSDALEKASAVPRCCARLPEPPCRFRYAITIVGRGKYQRAARMLTRHARRPDILLDSAHRALGGKVQLLALALHVVGAGEAGVSAVPNRNYDERQAYRIDQLYKCHSAL